MWWILGSIVFGVVLIVVGENGADNILLWLARQNIPTVETGEDKPADDKKKDDKKKNSKKKQVGPAEDKWWSPVRFKPLEGNILFIMKGNSKGPLDAIYHSITGWELDPVTGDLIDFSSPQAIQKLVADGDQRILALHQPIGTKEQTQLERLGLVWVGFYKGTYRRTIKYTTYETVGTEQMLIEKTRDDFFFQTNLAVDIKAAEDADNFPLNAKAIATMRIINPRKAEFLAGKPEVQALGAMEAEGRVYIGSKKFGDLRGKVEILSPLDLKTQFGIEMIAFRLEQVDPVDPNSDYARATQKIGIERLNADAKEQEARGVRKMAEAEAARVTTVYAAKKGNETLALTEAIEKFQGQTLVIGQVPGLSVPIPSGNSNSSQNTDPSSNTIPNPNPAPTTNLSPHPRQNPTQNKGGNRKQNNKKRR